MAGELKRKLTFYAWDDMPSREPFDRFLTADCLEEMTTDEAVFEDGGTLAAVLLRQKGTERSPTLVRLLNLRDFDSRPLRYRRACPVVRRT